MPAATDQREALVSTLTQFETRLLAAAGAKLLATLGYPSERHLPITTARQFCDQLDPGGKLAERERESLGRRREGELDPR